MDSMVFLVGLGKLIKTHLEEENIQMVVICHLYNYILHVI